MDQICLLDVDPKFEEVTCPYIRDEGTCKHFGCPMYKELHDPEETLSNLSKFDSLVSEVKKHLIIELDRTPAQNIKKFLIECLCDAFFANRHPDFMNYSETFTQKDDMKNGDS